MCPDVRNIGVVYNLDGLIYDEIWCTDETGELEGTSGNFPFKTGRFKTDRTEKGQNSTILADKIRILNNNILLQKWNESQVSPYNLSKLVHL